MQMHIIDISDDFFKFCFLVQIYILKEKMQFGIIDCI